MNKFKRYLGVAFSLLSLVLFIPMTSQDQRYQEPELVAPMGDSIAVNLLMSGNNKFALWKAVSSMRNTCKNLDSTYSCDEIAQNLDFDIFMKNLQALSDQNPALYPLWEAATLKDGKDKREYYAAANKGITDLLANAKPSLTLDAFLINLGLLALVILGVRSRQVVGNAIWAPFGMVWRIVSGGAKTAKNIHDKI